MRALKNGLTRRETPLRGLWFSPSVFPSSIQHPTPVFLASLSRRRHVSCALDLDHVTYIYAQARTLLCLTTTANQSCCGTAYAQCLKAINLSGGTQLLPRRVCYTRPSAMPGQHAQGHEQAQSHTAPSKNSCDKQVSSWRHISCHTDKNRYYT